MKLNLIPKREAARVSCSWHDTGLRRWAFELYDGGELWNIDADTVTLVCSNGAEVPCTFSGATVSADCTAELSANPGKYYCKLKIEKGTETLFSQAFELWVEDLKYGVN